MLSVMTVRKSYSILHQCKSNSVIWSMSLTKQIGWLLSFVHWI